MTYDKPKFKNPLPTQLLSVMLNGYDRMVEFLLDDNPPADGFVKYAFQLQHDIEKHARLKDRFEDQIMVDLAFSLLERLAYKNTTYHQLLPTYTGIKNKEIFILVKGWFNGSIEDYGIELLRKAVVDEPDTFNSILMVLNLAGIPIIKRVDKLYFYGDATVTVDLVGNDEVVEEPVATVENMFGTRIVIDGVHLSPELKIANNVITGGKTLDVLNFTSLLRDAVTNQEYMDAVRSPKTRVVNLTAMQILLTLTRTAMRYDTYMDISRLITPHIPRSINDTFSTQIDLIKEQTGVLTVRGSTLHHADNVSVIATAFSLLGFDVELETKDNGKKLISFNNPNRK
tara:strand:- start:2678 stop:3703 length:1026 start_codon:yes stop_codon:yes gene_type:complete